MLAVNQTAFPPASLEKEGSTPRSRILQVVHGDVSPFLSLFPCPKPRHPSAFWASERPYVVPPRDVAVCVGENYTIGLVVLEVLANRVALGSDSPAHGLSCHPGGKP